jgi:thioredoxin reductase
MIESGVRDARRFPTLTDAQLEQVRIASGVTPVAFAAGADVYGVGAIGIPAWFVVEGTLEIFSRAGLDGDVPIETLGPGQFSGEISQVTGRPTLAGARAGPQGCRAFALPAPQVRNLVVDFAEIGEIIMRAFVVRRAALIDTGSGGTIIIGLPDSPEMLRLRGFLNRNGYPHVVLDAIVDHKGRALVEQLGLPATDLPLVVCADGTMLRRPDEAELARCIGIGPDIAPGTLFDTAIIGAGPAGLAAAVYAASEGLNVLVLETSAIGGQAGASARIENYLGFPTGISGQALTGRAFTQALKFGANIALPLSVSQLLPGTDRGPVSLRLSNNQIVEARTAIVASGASYRHPHVDNLSNYEGRGVSYWASPVEAKLCEGEEIALIGGGNSAGQAVAFLAPRVKRLHLIIRRRDLTATMSSYLIERIAAQANVVLHPETEVTALEGTPSTGLNAAILRSSGSGNEVRLPLRHLFIFVGADPNTGWMEGCVETDEHGFIPTGAAAGAAALLRARLPLETSMPNVFAIGDVRSGSTKRIASAVGEGAAVVAQVHEALAPRDR